MLGGYRPHSVLTQGKVSESESVRIGKCLNRKVEELESVRIGKWQNSTAPLLIKFFADEIL